MVKAVSERDERKKHPLPTSAKLTEDRRVKCSKEMLGLTQTVTNWTLPSYLVTLENRV